MEEPDDILNSLKERTKQIMTLCDGLKEEKKSLLTTNRELIQKVDFQGRFGILLKNGNVRLL